MKFELNDFYAAIRKEKDPEFLGEGTCSETHHYLKAFQREQLVGWNWVAFLFAPIWLLYRRLYAAYVMLMVFAVVLSYMPSVLLIFVIVMNVMVGMFADSIYVYFVKQEHGRGYTLNPGNIPLIVLICAHIIIVTGVSQIQSYLESDPIDGVSNIVDDA
jgi:hypothetical protein